MKQLARIFQSELYKFFHSSLIYIHLMVPMLGIIIFLSYYTISTWEEADKILAYLQILAMVFPVLIAIITAISADSEANAGFYQFLLAVPYHKSTVHMVRLAILLIFGFLLLIVLIIWSNRWEDSGCKSES